METVIILSVLISLVFTAIVLSKDEERMNLKRQEELERYRNL